METASSHGSGVPRLTTAARWLRDAWLIGGLALALFLVLEGAYRAQGAVRRWLAPAQTDSRRDPQHPYANEPWYPTWLSQDLIGRHYRFDPYRTWWKKPVSGELIHLDSAGRRVTILPAAPDAPRRKVFFFGGSVMWGTTARDSFTIPSLVAAELARRGLAGVEAVNYASIGYNATQEVITLLLLLRDGEVPDVAVFLDGHNDVAGAWKDGRHGTVLNQERYARRMERTETGFWRSLAELGVRSALVQRLAQLAQPGDRPLRRRDAETLCQATGRAYRDLVLATEGMGRQFGFRPLFLWQPVMDLGNKALTPWERSIGPSPYRDVLIRCTAVVDSLLADRRGRSYASLTGALDTVTTSIWLDNAAHVTEAGNRLLAARISDLLEPLLTETPARSR